MGIVTNIVISSIVSVASLWFAAHFVPLGLLGEEPHTFGDTSITTIQGSDTLTSSRTTINNNFSSLNTNKLEISGLSSTTTLPNLTTLAALATVGTITSGTWNGSAVGAAYGGTGSTTLSSNQVILGNGTGAVKVVNGLGSSGQLLTSGGAGTPPTWTSPSVDTTVAYSWSGTHNFTGNTYIKNLNASSTLILGGLSLTFPTAIPAPVGTTTVAFRTNSSGVVGLFQDPWGFLASSTLSATAASTTITFAAATDLRVFIDVPTMAAATTLALQFNGDTSANYAYRYSQDAASTVAGSGQTNILFGPVTDGTEGFNIDMHISNVATTQKYVTWIGVDTKSGTNAGDILQGGGGWGNTSNAITSITIGSFGTLPIGTRIVVYGSSY